MCLIAVALNTHPDWPIVLLANRDEWLTRSSSAMHWWPEAPECIGGRDLQAGGSWLLVNRQGRLVTLTNDPRRARADNQASRGELVIRLAQDPRPLEHAMTDLIARKDRYAGFNLLAIDWQEPGPPRAAVLTNVAATDPIVWLDDGISTLTNTTLNTPWPKATYLGMSLARHLPEIAAGDSTRALAALRTCEAIHANGTSGPAQKQAGHTKAEDLQRVDNDLIDTLQEKIALAGASSPGGALAYPFVYSSNDAGYGTRVSSMARLHSDGRLALDEWHWSPATNPPQWNTRHASRFSTAPTQAEHA